MTAAHFGAAIEALQKAYFKASGSEADRRVVADSKAWDELCEKICLCIADANVTEDAKKILLNKAQNLNWAPQSTLLRMLALDILSEAPQFDCVRDRYTDFLPVWLSFPLWARMASERAAPPPIEEVVAAFLRAQNQPELAERMRKALGGARIILLVDGLDEAVDPTAAETVAALLSSFVEARGCPALITTRAQGLRAATRFAGNWLRADLALLSDTQRHALCKVWFRVLAEIGGEGAAGESSIERQVQQRASAFTADLQRNAAIARLSQTPLFLLALMELHRHGRQIPQSRFAAIEKIVEQLVEHQPKRRAVDSMATTTPRVNVRLRDRLIASFAFGLQSGELTGTVTDAATEETAMARAVALVLERQGSADREQAEAQARSIFDFAEERAGLLVKKAPRNIGFLHLSIQEFLAAKHVLQYPLPEKLAFVRAHAGLPRWREPILYLLYLAANEPEVGQLVRAIEESSAPSGPTANDRDVLLTEAVFADLAHDGNVARPIAARLLSQAELTGWGARQRELLSAAVDGLASETVATLSRSKIEEWVPNRFGYGRAAALRAMRRWPPALHGECLEVLMRSLGADEQTTRRAAAEILATFSSDVQHNPKDRILAFLKAAPSPGTIATALYALGQGWARDADVGALAGAARGSADPGIAVEGLRIRARRHETDIADFERFFAIYYRPRRFSSEEMGDRELIEYFAVAQRETFTARLRAAIADQHDRNAHALRPLIGSLVLCDPDDTLVLPGMLDLLKHDWNMRELFVPGKFPADKVHWRRELVSEVERFATAPNAHHDYELYHISKFVRTEVIKSQLIRSLKDDRTFRFWAARALAEGWGAGDEDVLAAILPFLEAEPAAVASVAEALAVVAPDKEVCRRALLGALRGRPEQVDFIFEGLRHLGVAGDDEEAFDAARDAWNGLDAPFYRDHWRAQMIRLFPQRPEIRLLAVQELNRQDGEIGAIAESYAYDAEMLSRVLRVLAPQPESSREVLISALRRSAPSSAVALGLLGAARHDTDGAISFEATIGWVEGLMARGALEPEHVEALVEELSAVGPDFESRRLAAVLGLAIAKHLERFAEAKDYQNRALTVSAARMSLRSDDRTLRAILAHWDELVRGLGGETQVFERLEITPEGVLPVIDPSYPNAEYVFERLMERVPSTPHLSTHIPLSALARFAPDGKRMREFILAAFTQSPGQYWQTLIAGEILAEHFAEDADLRHQVVAHVLRAPPGPGDGALAELLLRRPDPELERALREKTREASYDVATHFKLVAALASPPRVVEALEDLLTRDLSETNEFHFPRWISAVVRRIEKDAAVQERLQVQLTSDASPSKKASFVSLLARAAGVSERLRTFAISEHDRTNLKAMPEVGFDLSSQSYRLIRHVLIETFG